MNPNSMQIQKYQYSFGVQGQRAVFFLYLAYRFITATDY